MTTNMTDIRYCPRCLRHWDETGYVPPPKGKPSETLADWADCPNAANEGRYHDLKTWPEYFDPLWTGARTFELRKDDSGYQVGDKLWLREWHPGTGYSGRRVSVLVTYVLRGPFFPPNHSEMQPGLSQGWVILGFSWIEQANDGPSAVPTAEGGDLPDEH